MALDVRSTETRAFGAMMVFDRKTSGVIVALNSLRPTGLATSPTGWGWATPDATASVPSGSPHVQPKRVYLAYVPARHFSCLVSWGESWARKATTGLGFHCPPVGAFLPKPTMPSG